MRVAGLIRGARREAGLSLRELADRSGLAVSTIHRAERGELQPTVATLDRIVAAAGRRLVVELPSHSAGSVLGLGLAIRSDLESGDHSMVVRRAAELVARFDRSADAEKELILDAEPPATGSREWDAFLAGLTEWLAVRGGVAVPGWPAGPERFLDHGWWITSMTSLRAWEYAGTPVSLQRRGVFIHRASLVNR